MPDQQELGKLLFFSSLTHPLPSLYCQRELMPLHLFNFWFSYFFSIWKVICSLQKKNCKLKETKFEVQRRGKSLLEPILPLRHACHAPVTLRLWGLPARAGLAGKEGGGKQLEMADLSVPRITKDSGDWDLGVDSGNEPSSSPRAHDTPVWHEAYIRLWLLCSLPSLLLPRSAPGLRNAQEKWPSTGLFLNLGESGYRERCHPPTPTHFWETGGFSLRVYSNPPLFHCDSPPGVLG